MKELTLSYSRWVHQHMLYFDKLVNITNFFPELERLKIQVSVLPSKGTDPLIRPLLRLKTLTVTVQSESVLEKLAVLAPKVQHLNLHSDQFSLSSQTGINHPVVSFGSLARFQNLETLSLSCSDETWHKISAESFRGLPEALTSLRTCHVDFGFELSAIRKLLEAALRQMFGDKVEIICKHRRHR